MNYEWNNKDSHPTLPALHQVCQVFDELGESKKGDASDQILERAISAAGLQDRFSLLKKMQRLESSLGLNGEFCDLIRDWCDKQVSTEKWEKSLNECKLLIERIRSVLNAYEKLRGKLEEKTIKITIYTTNFLSTRFWPSVLERFYRLVANEKAKGEFRGDVEVDLHTLEPYTLLKVAGDTTVEDMGLTYGELKEVKRISRVSGIDVEFTKLHRCLLSHPNFGIHGPYFSFDLIKNKRVAWLRGFERVVPQLPIGELKNTAQSVQYFDTTEAVHAMVRSQCAVGFSHVEFLDEDDQKALDVTEFQPRGAYGESALVFFRPSCSTQPRGEKARFCEILARLVTERFSEMRRNYDESVRMTKRIQELDNSYHVSGTLIDGQLRRDLYRGKLNVLVTPSLFVRGNIHLHVVDNHPNPLRRRSSEDQKYLLFGRIRQCISNPSVWHMVLRGMGDMYIPKHHLADGSENGDVTNWKVDQEFFMASFLFKEETGKIMALAEEKNDNYIIGRWTGRMEDRTAPDEGLWIWHKNPKLELNDAKKLLSNYARDHFIEFNVDSVASMVGGPTHPWCPCKYLKRKSGGAKKR